jgi:SpoVK/Ycf46/Vps4 family AAA+-type ATPase
VLPEETLYRLKKLAARLRPGDTAADACSSSENTQAGFCVLFTGSSVADKTIAATLLGKAARRDVYGVALSAVVSRYIGETEKNLDKVFSKAERSHWILFFDEADALFGRRTGVIDAHDRYASPEAKALLQRMAAYSGLTVLASNQHRDREAASSRPFQLVIDFSAPGREPPLDT